MIFSWHVQSNQYLIPSSVLLMEELPHHRRYCCINIQKLQGCFSHLLIYRHTSQSTHYTSNKAHVMPNDLKQCKVDVRVNESSY